MLTSSSEEATAIYEKFLNVDIFSWRKNIQITLHPYHSLILKCKYHQLVKFTLVLIENLQRKTSLCILNQHFHSVPKQITLEMKLKEFTIDEAKKKWQNYTHRTLYKHPQKQWFSNINHMAFK